jgi:kindlin 2
MMTVMSSMVAPGASIDHNFNSNQMLFSAHSASLVSVGWQLRINVNEFDVIERSLRVTGETHIGGVIFQLVEQLSNIKNDWSDFSLWWPEKNQWLNKTKMTLDQYGVQADALLHFTRIHKCLRVQLPDLQILDLNVDYSISLFYSIKQICKEIGIRHSEEVSILKTLANNPLNQTKQTTINKKKKDKNLNKIEHQLLNIQSYSTSNNSKDCSSSVSSSTTSTLNNSSSNSNTNSSSNKLKREHSTSFSIENLNSFSFNNDAQSLTLSPIISINNYLNKNSIKFKSVFDKTRINSRFLS